MEEASFLSKYSDDITLIHRGPAFRASKAMQSRVLSNPNIKVLFNTRITRFNGADGRLVSVDIDTLPGNSPLKQGSIPVDGLFYGLGLKPNTGLFRDILELDDEGYVMARGTQTFNVHTDIIFDGVFVAGDAHDKIYRQAIVAAGDGCRAAMDTISWLSI
jgi:thioredoxin reductase (NADPH)